MGCQRFHSLIGFGVFFIIVGFIVTMVGNFAKPFWTEKDDWCSFCKEERETTEQNLRNCRTAGPIVLTLGIVLTVIGFVMRRKEAGKAPSGGFVTQPGGYTTASYASTGQIGTTAAPYQPVGGSYPPSATGYPPSTAGYPPGPSYTPSTTSTTYPYPAQTGAPYTNTGYNQPMQPPYPAATQQYSPHPGPVPYPPAEGQGEHNNNNNNNNNNNSDNNNDSVAHIFVL